MLQPTCESGRVATSIDGTQGGGNVRIHNSAICALTTQRKHHRGGSFFLIPIFFLFVVLLLVDSVIKLDRDGHIVVNVARTTTTKKPDNLGQNEADNI